MDIRQLAMFAAAITAFVAQALIQPGYAADHAISGNVDGLEAKFIDIGGVSTRYYDYGSGEVIILVHGGRLGGSSANSFSRVIPELAERFRVIAVDRLAQGLTGNPASDEDFSSRGILNHFTAFIDTLKLDEMHLVGNSAGGSTVLYYTLEHPEKVKTLTFVASGPQDAAPAQGPSRYVADLQENCTQDPNSAAFRYCRQQFLGHTPNTFPPDYAAVDEAIGQSPKNVETRTRVDALNEARPGYLSQVNSAMLKDSSDKIREGALQVPVLVMASMNDPMSWVAGDEYAMMRREIDFYHFIGAKNARVKLVVFNEAGHFPQRDLPAQFNAELTGFIDFWNANP